MDLSQLVIDPYNRRARLQPALLGMLPLALVVVLLYPELETRLARISGLLISFGGAIWLTQVGRDRGRRLEPKLFAMWGGKPSVAILRHRDQRLSPAIKSRYHAFLQTHVPGLAIPTAEEEARDPEKADEEYGAASTWLVARTRDRQKYRLIFEENMNYGFRRNYWAIRWYAVALDILLLLGLIALAMNRWAGDWRTTLLGLGPLFWGAFAVPALHSGLTLLVARVPWVASVADAYASQLLAACDVMHQERR